VSEQLDWKDRGGQLEILDDLGIKKSRSIHQKGFKGGKEEEGRGKEREETHAARQSL
jgi:hypothetical protein